MMHNWFECKIRYDKVTENGMEKKATELYLIDALSFTEAEERMNEYIKPFMSGDFVISSIKRANYTDVFGSEKEEHDKWFKCKVTLISIDEKTMKEKRSSYYSLVQADNVKTATDMMELKMKGCLSDFEISSTSETAIMDVYEYNK